MQQFSDTDFRSIFIVAAIAAGIEAAEKRRESDRLAELQAAAKRRMERNGRMAHI